MIEREGERERERGMETKGKTLAACPAPPSVSGEQGIMEMYKMQERGRLTDRERVRE